MMTLSTADRITEHAIKGRIHRSIFHSTLRYSLNEMGSERIAGSSWERKVAATSWSVWVVYLVTVTSPLMDPLSTPGEISSFFVDMFVVMVV